MNEVRVAGTTIAPRLGVVALASVVVFAIACVVVQWLRTDLDWQQAPLSFYLMDDYGFDPVEGELVGSSVHELALRRSAPEVGEVVVHFPRAGFRVQTP